MKKYFISYSHSWFPYRDTFFGNDIIEWKQIETKEDIKELESHLEEKYKENNYSSITLLGYSPL